MFFRAIWRNLFLLHMFVGRYRPGNSNFRVPMNVHPQRVPFGFVPIILSDNGLRTVINRGERRTDSRNNFSNVCGLIFARFPVALGVARGSLTCRA